MNKINHTTLLFLRKSDQILLALKKRGFGQGLWNGVGGKIEADETSVQAAIREAQEEVRVTPERVKQVARFFFEFADDNATPSIDMTVFTADTWQGEPTETEEMAPRWFDIDKIPYTQMWEDDLYWLPRMLDGELLRGRFKFQNGKIADHNLGTVRNFDD